MKKIGWALLVLALLAMPAWAAFAEADSGEWLYVEDTDGAVEESETWEDYLSEAMEVYRWFGTSPLDVDETVTDDSGEYFLVLDERYNTYDGLRQTVAAYFGDGIADTLMNNGTYMDFDGLLYTKATPQAQDTQPLETEYVISEETPAMVIYDLSAYYADRTDQFTYVLENIDGEWRFTQFPACF